MRAQVEIEGARELAALLRQIGDKDLQKALRQTHKAVAALVEHRAESLVKVRTGNLQSAIRAGGTLTAAVVRAGSSKVKYAAANHWGRKTGNVGSPPGNHPGKNVVQGNPFLWNAGEQVTPAALALYERQVSDVMARASAGRL